MNWSRTGFHELCILANIFPSLSKGYFFSVQAAVFDCQPLAATCLLNSFVFKKNLCIESCESDTCFFFHNVENCFYFDLIFFKLIIVFI